MAELNHEGSFSPSRRYARKVGMVGLFSASALVSCQMAIGLDDLPTLPSCPEGTVRAGFDDESCVPVAGGGGASGDGGRTGAGSTGAGGAGGRGDGEGAAGAKEGGGHSGEGIGGTAGAGTGGADAGAGSGAPGEVMATGQVNVRQMAIDVSTQGTLFWVTAGTEVNGYDDGKVLSCSVDDCPGSLKTIAFAQARPEFVAVADENCPKGSDAKNYVYWTTALGEVKYCEKAGCGAEATILAENQAGVAGVRVTPPLPDNTDPSAVIAVWASADAGEVRQCPAGGCVGGDAPFASQAPAKPRHLVSGNTFIYWLEEDIAADGWLYKLRKDRTELPVLQVGPLDSSTKFALASSRLFAIVRGADAIVWTAPTSDVKGSYIEGRKQLLAIDAHGLSGTNKGRVYWNDDGDLWYCAISENPGPCEGAQMLLQGVGRSKSLLADDDYVYFPYEADGTLRRVPQPAW